MLDTIPRVYRDPDVFNRAVDELLGRFVIRALRRSVRAVAGALSTDPAHVLALATPTDTGKITARRSPTPIASKRARTQDHARRGGKPLPHRGRRGAAR